MVFQMLCVCFMLGPIYVPGFIWRYYMTNPKSCEKIEVKKKTRCIFCEWEPNLEDIEWGVCYGCVDKCELDINTIKCKVFEKEVSSK